MAGKNRKMPVHTCELCGQPTDCPMDVCGSVVCPDCSVQAMRDHGVRDDGINGFVPIRETATEQRRRREQVERNKLHDTLHDLLGGGF